MFTKTEDQLEEFLSNEIPPEWSIEKLYFEDPYSHAYAYVSIVIKYQTPLRDRTADELNAEHDEIANLIVHFINNNLTMPEEFGYEESRVEGWQM